MVQFLWGGVGGGVGRLEFSSVSANQALFGVRRLAAAFTAQSAAPELTCRKPIFRFGVRDAEP